MRAGWRNAEGAHASIRPNARRQRAGGETTPTLLCNAVPTATHTSAQPRTVQTCADGYAVNPCRLVLPTFCPTTIANNCICALVAEAGDVNKCLARSWKRRKHCAGFRHHIAARFESREQVRSALCGLDCRVKTATGMLLHSGRRLGRNYGALPFLVMQRPWQVFCYRCMS